MEAFAGYLFRSAVWLTGFSLVYLLLLRNERFFRIKRFFLIAGIAASMVFPLIVFHYKVEMTEPPALFPDIMQQAGQGSPVSQQSGERNAIDYLNILLMLYLTGVVFLAFRMIRHMTAVSGIIKKSKVSKRGEVRIVQSSGISSSFSFFNYVFINPSLEKAEAEQILNHEEVHVQQGHWFDLILAELIRMFQWANPFAWIYAGFIKQNHEFLADESALVRSQDPACYRAVLLNQIFKAPVISLSNSFSYSINKKRFDMMKSIITSPYRKLKLLVVLPVTALLFYAFATPVYNYSPETPAPGKMEMTMYGADPIIQVEVRGIVIDKEGKPLAKVNITSTGRQGEAKYATTGPDGKFSITVTPDATLLVSCEGYAGKTIRQPFDKDLRIVLETVSAAIPKADNEVLMNKKNEVLKLQPEPLFVLNGVPLSKSAVEAIDIETIRTISVLKDQSATAAFGEKGKNGVIIITTKSYRPQGNPLVAVDGVMTDKDFRTAQKDLGYDFGISRLVSGPAAIEKYGEKGANGVYEITTRKKALEMGLKPPFPRLSKDDYPTFPVDGFPDFTEWVADQVKYPAEAKAQNIEGWVSVSFTVEMDGTITNVRSAAPVIPVLSDAVVNLVKSSPKWEPPKNKAVDEPLNRNVMLRFRLPDQVSTQAPFVVVEQMPLFPGGDAELLKFIGENTNYPDSAKTKGIQGRVIVRFIVNTEGKAEGASILKGVDPYLDAEALRVISTLPAFNPGKQGGTPVNVWYMVPITFTLK